MKRTLMKEMMDGIYIDRVLREHEFTMPSKHVHDEYEIYYLMEGERYYFIENKTYLIKEGTLVFVSKGQIHKTGDTGKSHHDRILIELKEEPFGTFLSSAFGISLADFFANHYGVLKLDTNGQNYVKSQLLGIVDELRSRKPYYEAMAMTKLSNLLIYAIRYNEQENLQPVTPLSDTPKHRKVDEVASYIMENPTEVKSLDELSKQFYISKCYLSRIFKEVTGFTITEYINIHRIQKAKLLLSDTDFSITEISDQLGYESITYFEKVFSKFTETSPLKYRKQQRKLIQSLREKKPEKEVSR